MADVDPRRTQHQCGGGHDRDGKRRADREAEVDVGAIEEEIATSPFFLDRAGREEEQLVRHDRAPEDRDRPIEVRGVTFPMRHRRMRGLRQQ
jgi:hypothetical protein